MKRVQLNHITFDISYDKGLYTAHTTTGPSSSGHDIEELSANLAESTGIKQKDLFVYLNEIFDQ